MNNKLTNKAQADQQAKIDAQRQRQMQDTRNMNSHVAETYKTNFAAEQKRIEEARKKRNGGW